MRLKKTLATIAAMAAGFTMLATPVAGADTKPGDAIDYSMSFGNTNPVVAYPGAPVHTIVGGDTDRSCSLGPRMVDGETDRVYFAIAGHCVAAAGVDSTVYFDHNDAPAGKVRWIDPRINEAEVAYDLAVIEVTDPDAAGYTSIVPNLNKLPVDRASSPIGNFTLDNFGDSRGTICAIGRKSDLRCGTAVKADGDYAYGFKFDSISGDSGGIAFAVDNDKNIYPVGVVSGVSELVGGGKVSMVTDIDLAREGGYTLWHGTN